MYGVLHTVYKLIYSLFKSEFCEVILCSLPEIASLVSAAHSLGMCLQRINK